MKDAIGVAILGIILGCMFGYGSAHAQTYQMTNPQGYSQGTCLLYTSDAADE